MSSHPSHDGKTLKPHNNFGKGYKTSTITEL